MSEKIDTIVPVQWPLRLINLLFILLLFSWAFYWFATDIHEIITEQLMGLDPAFLERLQVLIPQHEFLARILGSLVSCLELLPLLYGLYQLRRLILLYGEGKLFTAQHVKAFRNIAFCFIAYAAALFIYSIAMPLALTTENPSGEHILAVSLTTDMIIPFLTGFILLPLTHVMAAAQKMAEEQELTV